jgi:hypothetical protein
MLCASQRAPHCSILLSQTDRPSLAPFDDQGYPFSRIVLSANRMKLGPGGGSRAQDLSRTAFVSDQNDAWRSKGIRHDQARPIGARDAITALPFPAEARSTEERSQGPLSDQGPETVRRRAIPSPEANTNLTNYLDDLRGRHIRKFGCLCSVREPSWRTDAINRWRVDDLDTKHDLILAGGHRSRRTFLVTVEDDEHAQV